MAILQCPQLYDFTCLRVALSNLLGQPRAPGQNAPETWQNQSRKCHHAEFYVQSIGTADTCRHDVIGRNNKHLQNIAETHLLNISCSCMFAIPSIPSSKLWSSVPKLDKSELQVAVLADLELTWHDCFGSRLGGLQKSHNSES